MSDVDAAALFNQPDRNLALELVRATEAAAIRAVPFVGTGDKEGADGAAVEAMRRFLNTVPMDGRVVIGEGEKDQAPMLHNGEHVGTGIGPACDIAVDPIDGTSLAAAGRHNAVSMLALADRGTMLDAHTVFYMRKLVAGPSGTGVVDINQTVHENVREYARAAKKPVREVVVAVLDRPRHQSLIEEIRASGATTELLLDGDVAGGIRAALPDTRIDMCIGTGGSPEGIATACAVTALNGHMQAVLAPSSTAEVTAGSAAGLRFDHVYELAELVTSDNTIFIATGVTDGDLVKGVYRRQNLIRTESIVLRARSGTVRYISANHLAHKWLDPQSTHLGSR